MSEPSYRVELEHEPASTLGVPWKASVYRNDHDGELLTVEYGTTRDRAFDKAQEWCKLAAITPERPSTVFLTEDGELLDPFDTVQT